MDSRGYWTPSVQITHEIKNEETDLFYNRRQNKCFTLNRRGHLVQWPAIQLNENIQIVIDGSYVHVTNRGGGVHCTYRSEHVSYGYILEDIHDILDMGNHVTVERGGETIYVLQLSVRERVVSDYLYNRAGSDTDGIFIRYRSGRTPITPAEFLKLMELADAMSLPVSDDERPILARTRAYYLLISEPIPELIELIPEPIPELIELIPEPIPEPTSSTRSMELSFTTEPEVVPTEDPFLSEQMIRHMNNYLILAGGSPGLQFEDAPAFLPFRIGTTAPKKEHKTGRTLPKHVTDILLQHAETAGTICPITMEPIRTETGAVTICGHVFNRAALHKWRETHTTCPECRNIL